MRRHPKTHARVYYFPKSDDEDKAFIIFDGGYEGGDIHVYEHKETFNASELQEQLKKYGHHIQWKLISE